MTVVSRIKKLPKGVLLVIVAMLAVGSFLVIDNLFGIFPRKYTLLCEYSGGAGETKTESFHLEREGIVNLQSYTMVLTHPQIEVHRLYVNQPPQIMHWKYINNRWEPDSVYLDPGDYYIIVKASAGSSWKIKVEEAVS